MRGRDTDRPLCLGSLILAVGHVQGLP
ncbi:hypothetical protein ACWD25_37790 [Streptomyces sp. NPDC002920]